MPKVDVDVCPTCKQRKGEAHKIITKKPQRLSLWHCVDDDMVRATDGCFTTAGGKCLHGHNSWAVVLKMVVPTGERRTIPHFVRG